MKTVEQKVKEIIEQLNKVEQFPCKYKFNYINKNKAHYIYGEDWRLAEVEYAVHLHAERFGWSQLREWKKACNNRRLRIVHWGVSCSLLKVNRWVDVVLFMFRYEAP